MLSERGVVMNEKMDLYIDDLAENQGVLFTKAVEQGFDLCSFANMYLRSSPIQRAISTIEIALFYF